MLSYKHLAPDTYHLSHKDHRLQMSRMYLILWSFSQALLVPVRTHALYVLLWTCGMHLGGAGWSVLKID